MQKIRDHLILMCYDAFMSIWQYLNLMNITCWYHVLIFIRECLDIAQCVKSSLYLSRASHLDSTSSLLYHKHHTILFQIYLRIFFWQLIASANRSLWSHLYNVCNIRRELLKVSLSRWLFDNLIVSTSAFAFFITSLYIVEQWFF